MVLSILFLYASMLGCISAMIATKASNQLMTTQDNKLVDALLDLASTKYIRVYDNYDFQLRKQQIYNKYRQNSDELETCIEEIGNYTYDLYSGKNREMLSNMFSDIGDMGSYDECEQLEFARFNILQLNLTNLPIEVRLGLCLPLNCTQRVMNEAAGSISDALTNLASTLGKKLNIDLITKFNLGINITFTQPDSWADRQHEEKTATASAIAGVFLLFVAIAGGASAVGHFKPKVLPSSQPPPDKKATRQALFAAEEARVRESTKPFTFKFVGSNGRPAADSAGSQPEDRDNSIFDSADPASSSAPAEQSSLVADVLRCFSVPGNLYALSAPRQTEGEHPGLATLEGIKVLTMCWGILTATALYALQAPVRNLYVLLELFRQYLFACIASGNLAPDLFLFLVYFLGFVKVCRFYEGRSGIGLVGYGQLYTLRFLRLAPLYYFVFFGGWFIVPLISRSANWFVAERLFFNCSAQWHWVMLFLNNLIPFFTKALEGCYYWPFVISNDMLLFSLLPLSVMIYKRNKIVFMIFGSIILIGGIAI